MSSTANSYHCDHLDRHTLLPPFTSEQEELSHVDEQINSLESHISQLTALHHALLIRSRNLRNLLSPIRKLPVEIISYIFEQLVDAVMDTDDHQCKLYRACLRQAFTLASVSSYFRHITLGIPELWRRIPLNIVNLDAIDNASSLLRYCSALTPALDLDVETGKDLDDEEVSRSCIDALITPDITCKVKSFDLHGLHNGSSSGLWIEKLKEFGSPMLHTLTIKTGSTPILSFDIRVLTAVNRLRLSSRIANNMVLVPPSLQYLTVSEVPGENLEPLLRQCPNLIECDICWFGTPNSSLEFITPLTLPHLKSLFFLNLSSTHMQNFHLPSLERLEIGQFEGGAILLCRSVAATLTSLCIYVDADNINDGLPQLCSMSLPKLEELDIRILDQLDPHLDPVLQQMEDDHHRNPRLHYPVLKSIIICFLDRMGPSSPLTWLGNSEIGRAFFYDINFDHFQLKADEWSPDLREELRSIVGSRRMEITWDDCKIYELGVQDASV